MLPSWVSSRCYQQMLDQTGKFLPGAYILAYSASSSAIKKKSFITLTPGANVGKLVLFTNDAAQNKLERLSSQVFLLVEPDLTVVSYKNLFLVQHQFQNSKLLFFDEISLNLFINFLTFVLIYLMPLFLMQNGIQSVILCINSVICATIDQY